MSGEALYERYKEALKRGHVASLRGRIDEALDAYAEAARIAPERSTPHTSAGTALMRRKRPADALRQYEAALRIGPHDAAAMLGRAQALDALGRRADAADAYDALADLHASSGRLADAVDAARRALELAEGRHRRRMLEGLIERLRASEPGEPGRVALERALQVLDGSALPGRARAGAGQAMAPAVAPEDSAGPAEAAVEHDPVGEPLPGDAAEQTTAQEPEPGPVGESEIAIEAGSEPEPSLEPEPGPVITRALDRTVPEPADLEVLSLLAEAALDARDPSASERFLDLAAASHREGRTDVALDACYQALSLDPDGTGLHLALVQLYDREGWTTLASEKLDLLARLASLEDDSETATQVANARSSRP